MSNKLLEGVMWACRSDETLAQAVRAACAAAERKLGKRPNVVLVHRSVELEVAGLETRVSPYIADPRLIFVGWEKEEE